MNSKKMMLIGVIVLIIALGFGVILFLMSPRDRKDEVGPTDSTNTIKSEDPANKPVHSSSSSKKAKEAGTQIVASRETIEGDAIQGGGMTGDAPPSGKMIAMAKSVTGGKSREIEGSGERKNEVADTGALPGSTTDAEKASTKVADNRLAGAPPMMPSASTKAETKENRGTVIFIFDISPYEIRENGKLIYNKDKLPSSDRTEIQDDGKKFILTRPEGSYSYTFTLQNHREIKQNVKTGKGKAETFNLEFGK